MSLNDKEVDLLMKFPEIRLEKQCGWWGTLHATKVPQAPSI
jgi:hypothetical protein